MRLLNNAKYNSANELYLLPNGEYMARIAYKQEIDELELKLARITEKRRTIIDDDKRWLNGGM